MVLRTTDHDDGWTMVDRDSEGNSDASSSEEEDNVSDCGLERVRLDRTSSLDSLTHVNVMDMEESWFVTPPPCFSSQTGYYFIQIFHFVSIFVTITKTRADSLTNISPRKPADRTSFDERLSANGKSSSAPSITDAFGWSR